MEIIEQAEEIDRDTQFKIDLIVWKYQYFKLNPIFLKKFKIDLIVWKYFQTFMDF